jgi:hypothetical protein
MESRDEMDLTAYLQTEGRRRAAELGGQPAHRKPRHRGADTPDTTITTTTATRHPGQRTATAPKPQRGVAAHGCCLGCGCAR